MVFANGHEEIGKDVKRKNIRFYDGKFSNDILDRIIKLKGNEQEVFSECLFFYKNEPVWYVDLDFTIEVMSEYEIIGTLYSKINVGDSFLVKYKNVKMVLTSIYDEKLEQVNKFRKDKKYRFIINGIDWNTRTIIRSFVITNEEQMAGV